MMALFASEYKTLFSRSIHKVMDSRQSASVNFPSCPSSFLPAVRLDKT